MLPGESVVVTLYARFVRQSVLENVLFPETNTGLALVSVALNTFS